jgi:hypothetical protein
VAEPSPVEAGIIGPSWKRKPTDSKIVHDVTPPMPDRMRGKGILRGTYLGGRLERYDKDGNRLSPVPLKFNQYQSQGTVMASLNDGDEVEVKGKWLKEGDFRAKEIRNITTGGVVKEPRGAKVAKGLFLLFFIAVVLFIIMTFFIQFFIPFGR